MSRLRTPNTPDLQALLTPVTARNPVTLAVERSLMRERDWSAPVAEQIAVRLAGLITIDVIQAGQRLLEADISKVLNVSRAPVREALRILERERLVEFRARRGAIVTAPDEHDLRNIYVVREALYSILLRELMENRPEDLETLLAHRLLHVANAAKTSADAYASASFLTNLAITDLSSNRLASDLLNSISLRTLRYVRLSLAATPDLVEDSLNSWRALHRAILKRDVDAVLQTAQRRIEGLRDAAVRTLLLPATGRGQSLHRPRRAKRMPALSARQS